MNQVAVGFLYHNNKLLIAKRSRNSKIFPGKYEIPGGMVEKGEDLKSALKREIREELNLDVDVLQPFYKFVFDNNGVKYAETAFFIKPKDGIGSLKLSEEHEEYRWVTEDEIDDYDIIAEEKDAIKQGFKKLSHLS